MMVFTLAVSLFALLVFADLELHKEETSELRLNKTNVSENECSLLASGLVPNHSPVCCHRSCEGQCGATPVTTKNSRLHCSCDADCMVYGDCCYDFYWRCLSWTADDIINWNKTYNSIIFLFRTSKNNLEELAIKSQLHQHEMCIKTNEGYFWMISNCPPGSNTSLSSLCEDTHLTMFGSVPVSDKQFSRTYRNIHCAKCHGLGTDDLIIWKSFVWCPDSVDKAVLSNLEKLKQLLRSYVCEIKSKSPTKTPRVCFSDDVRSRSSDEQGLNVSLSESCRLCQVYRYSIFTDFGKQFHNPHCLQCSPDYAANRNTTVMECDSAHFSYYGKSLPVCDAEYSCKDACGRPYESAISVCQCDPLCILFGDCCFDYYSQCLHSSLQEIVKLVAENQTLDSNVSLNRLPWNEYDYLTILKFLQYRKHQSCLKYEYVKVWTITQCPTTYTNLTIRNKCMDAGLENIPFSHKEINFITFKNKYCAQCHNMYMHDKKDKLVPWPSLTNCSVRSNPRLTYANWLDLLVKRCSVSVSQPTNSYIVLRTCMYDDDDKESSDMTLCSSYQFPIVDKLGKRIKNPHCVADYNTDSFWCYMENKREPEYELKPQGLSVLFNFHTGGNGVTLLVDGAVRKIKTRQVRCEMDEVYNIFIEQCTSLVCPIGMIPINGSCVIRGMHVIDKNTQLLPNGSQQLYLQLSTDALNDGEVLLMWIFVKYRQQISQKNNFSIDTILKNFDKYRNVVIDEKTFFERISKLNARSLDAIDHHTAQSVIEKLSEVLQNKSFYLTLSSSTDLFLSKTIALLNTETGVSTKTMMFLRNIIIRNYREVEKLTCTEGFKKKWLDPTFSLIDETYYGNISNRYFALTSIPFELRVDVSNLTVEIISIIICDLFLDCTAVSYNESEFEVHSNSLMLVDNGQVVDSGLFLLLGDTALVCSNFSTNYTYFEHVRFFDFNPNQSIVTIATATVSILCLLLTLTVYSMLPVLRNIPGKLIMSLSLTLLVSQSMFLLIQIPTGKLCIAFAIMLHFCWLSSFAWMTVIGINLTKTFRLNASRSAMFQTGKSYIRYALLGWGTSLCIVFISTAVDLAEISGISIGYGKGNVCWISNNTASLVVFGGPLAVFLLINIACFGITMYGIEKTTRLSNSISSTRQDRQTFWIYSKLFVITGLSWCFCFVAAFVNMEAIWYVFIVTNNLQGLYIFVAYVCTSRTFDILKKKFTSSEKLYTSNTPNTLVSFSSEAVM